MTTILLRGGRVIDPTQGLDAQRDVLIRDGRVEALETPGVLDGLAELRNHGQLYMPVIFPGFSWYNLVREAPKNWEILKRMVSMHV